MKEGMIEDKMASVESRSDERSLDARAPKFNNARGNIWQEQLPFDA